MSRQSIVSSFSAQTQPAKSYSGTHLAHANVDKSFGGGMGNFEQFHDGGAVIANRDPAAIKDQLVHAPRAQRGADRISYCLTGIDITNQLRFSLCRAG